MDHLTQRVGPARRWWLERELVWVVAVAVVAHFFRLEAVTVRGEESRRAVIAAEVLRTGDWVVPTLQGEPWLSRPPLQYWLIALAGWLRGGCDAAAARLPSALATLLAAALVYGYARNFLPRLGSLAAGAAFATMGQVLKLGRMAETESVFTLLLAASLLVWHWGYLRGWPAWRLWTSGYALAALATLAKGTQAPVYFAASTALFLLLAGQWRRLLTAGHAAGVATYAAVLGVWLVPFYLRLGADGVRRVFTEAAAERFFAAGWADYAGHLAFFPLEVFGCLLPWSLLLLGYSRPSFWATMRPRQGEAQDRARSAVLFAVTCCAVTFPTVWLAIGGRSRYWMPLYPVVAPLVGLMVQRCVEAREGSPLRSAWTLFLTACAAALAGVVFLAAAGTGLQRLTGLPLAQPGPATAGFVVVMAALLALLWRDRAGFDPWRARLPVFALALALALAHGFWFVNLLQNDSVRTGDAVGEVRDLIGDARLVSLGRVPHLFTFHYGGPIPQVPVDQAELGGADVPAYFCFERAGDLPPPDLPFAWEKVAEVNCDRSVKPAVNVVVVVGRRLGGGGETSQK